MNGIIYCRVSTKEQVEGTSLESQQQACLKFAAERGIHVLRTFIERGESAKYADRTELGRLIEYCKDKSNGVQALIVWKIDRFARNVRDHFYIKEILNQTGVTIHSVTEPFDSQPVGKYLETMLAGAAQFENDIRALRCVGGMQRKIEEGLFPWKPPLGYLSASPFKAKKTQPDVPDPERFHVIKEGWRRVLAGTAIKADMVRYFRAQGLTTKAGKAVSVQMVDKIFSNKYYAGIVRNPWSGEECEGKHRPMISPEEFCLAQKILKRRANSQPHRKLRPDFPLRGFLCCPKCSHPLTASWSEGRSRKYGYYHCHNKSCNRRGKGIPNKAVESKFLNYLQRLAPKQDLAPRLENRLISLTTRDQKKREKRADRLRGRMQQLQRENTELVTMRRKNLISDPEFLKAHDQLQEEIASLAIAIHHVTASTQVGSEEIRTAFEFLSRLPAAVEMLPIDYRYRFQHILFPGGLIVDRFRTAKKSPIFEFIETFGGGDTTGVDLSGIEPQAVLALDCKEFHPKGRKPGIANGKLVNVRIFGIRPSMITLFFQTGMKYIFLLLDKIALLFNSLLSEIIGECKSRKRLFRSSRYFTKRNSTKMFLTIKLGKWQRACLSCINCYYNNSVLTNPFLPSLPKLNNHREFDAKCWGTVSTRLSDHNLIL